MYGALFFGVQLEPNEICTEKIWAESERLMGGGATAVAAGRGLLFAGALQLGHEKNPWKIRISKGSSHWKACHAMLSRYIVDIYIYR